MGCHSKPRRFLLKGVQVRAQTSPWSHHSIRQSTQCLWLICLADSPAMEAYLSFMRHNKASGRNSLLLLRYYEEKGFAVILVSRILNLLALAFTIAFSAFLLLFVKWRALHSECILRDTCDISEVCPIEHNFICQLDVDMLLTFC